MSDLNIANRYATALIELAEEKKIFEAVSEDVDLIYNTLKSSRELRVVLESPVIKRENKHSVLSSIFSNRISKDSMNFISFIVEKQREDLLYNIMQRFLKMRDERLGIVDAEVVSSIELIDEHKIKIEKKLQEYTGKKVRISFSLDKELIGGFKVRIEDTIIDASLKHQLANLKEQFLKGNTSLN